eukprot:6232060-Pyramimonas_sp.AAC.1
MARQSRWIYSLRKRKHDSGSCSVGVGTNVARLGGVPGRRLVPYPVEVLPEVPLESLRGLGRGLAGAA